MDDLRMLDTLLTKPGPSAEVTERGRERLRAVARGTVRRRRFAWPVAAPLAALAAAATAAVVAFANGSPTATPHGPPAAPSGRQVLLAAAVSAEAHLAGSGTYWHVKTVHSDYRTTSTMESWTRRDGREYERNGSGRVFRISGRASAFDLGAGELTFARIQRLPTDPAALKAKLTGMIHARFAKIPGHVEDHIVGPGTDPLLIDSLTDLLARVPAPPKVRAAAFRAIASLPGVSRVGPASGGQTLLIRGDAGDVKMVVDPVSSLVRGWTATPPDPSRHAVAGLAAQWVSIPTAEWTSDLPGRR